MSKTPQSRKTKDGSTGNGPSLTVSSDLLTLPARRQGRVTSPFERQRKGAFVLRLPTGRKLRFKDAYYRGLAYRALHSKTFESVGQMVEEARSMPNGFTAFEADGD